MPVSIEQLYTLIENQRREQKSDLEEFKREAMASMEGVRDEVRRSAEAAAAKYGELHDEIYGKSGTNGLKGRLGRLEERLTISQMFQAGYTTLLTGVAAAVAAFRQP